MTKVFWDGPRVGTGRDSPRGVGNLQLCTNLPEVLRFQGVEFVTKHILAACFSHLQFKLKPNLQPGQLNHFPFLSQHKLQVALAAIHAPGARQIRRTRRPRPLPMQQMPSSRCRQVTRQKGQRMATRLGLPKVHWKGSSVLIECGPKQHQGRIWIN